ncbi:dienelactone hydrolase family protein [Pseudomonas monteilii]|uniref:dienelactone hydrolase family protein n=1 Tax=Pseudomonas monteilii TaxID=76759 RepID=UPI003D055FF3
MNKGTMISFKRPDGQRLQGYLATSADGSAGPAVIVLQEWWGLNDQIRGVADRLADAGYSALVPDLYRGKSTVEAEEAHHLMSGLDFADAANQDIAGAVSFLRETTTKVAVMGYCMGGALAMMAMAKNQGIAAGVTWYGFPPLEALSTIESDAPLLGHWATHDDFFPLTGVEKLEAHLAETSMPFTFHRYLALHGFANETAIGHGRMPTTHYDATWSQTAWDRTLTFLGKHLWK